jgi:hypothetical protein
MPKETLSQVVVVVSEFHLKLNSLVFKSESPSACIERKDDVVNAC